MPVQLIRSIAFTFLVSTLSYNSLLAQTAGDLFLYPIDFVPPTESRDEILAREKKFEVAWKAYFEKLDALTKQADAVEIGRFVKANRADTIQVLITDYGYTALKVPLLAKLKADFDKNIGQAAKVLDGKGIKDIGDVENFSAALNAAVILKGFGGFTPEQSTKIEALVTQYVEGKSVFWGFTRKFPYFLSGYNKEIITMDVASNVKLLYQGTGKFPNTIDSFDAAWTQLTEQAYETDNSPHYDSSVNLHFILKMAAAHGLVEDVRNAPHFRMIFDRMAKTVMANGESANYGKSMAVLRTSKKDGIPVDDLMVHGAGIGRCMRWAYKFYGDPRYLYLARKYEMTNEGPTAPVTVMHKSLDLNFFNVHGAAYPADAPLCYSTIRLKGSGGTLDRGMRREDIRPVQDKLVLSTGSHPRSPTMLMDMSFTQSKVKDKRRMGIDNLIFNGAHTVTVVGRPDNAEETNRIFIAPDDITYPGTGEFAKEKSAHDAAQSYQFNDCTASRINGHLAFGEISYSQLQYKGVHAKRKMALLNNGVMVVQDQICSDDTYTGGKNAGTVYNIWTQVLQKGANWVITNPKVSHLPEPTSSDQMCTLVYFAPLTGLKIGLNSDIDFHSHAPLLKSKPLTIVSAIIPLSYQMARKNGKAIGEGIRTELSATGDMVMRIPYEARGRNLTVSIPADEKRTPRYEIEGGTTATRPPAVPKLNARVNPPYSIAFGQQSEFYVPDFKADFEMNENRFSAVWHEGKALTRGTDYTTSGNVLNLIPEFSEQLIKSGRRTSLTVKFTPGADVVLKLNGNTQPHITLLNSKRSKSYTANQMLLPYGFRENDRLQAKGADFDVVFYDDWLYRGNPTKVTIKEGKTAKLGNSGYKSFKVSIKPTETPSSLSSGH